MSDKKTSKPPKKTVKRTKAPDNGKTDGVLKKPAKSNTSGKPVKKPNTASVKPNTVKKAEKVKASAKRNETVKASPDDLLEKQARHDAKVEQERDALLAKTAPKRKGKGDDVNDIDVADIAQGAEKTGNDTGVCMDENDPAYFTRRPDGQRRRSVPDYNPPKAPEVPELDVANLPDRWTVKQALFAQALVADPKRNATEAAKVAGFSHKTAHQIAYRLLNDVEYSHVPAYVNAKTQIMLDRYEITNDKLLREQAFMAFSNILDYISIDREGLPFVDFSMLTPEQGAALAEFEIQEASEFAGRKVKFKLRDKQKALDVLMKYRNMVAPETGKIDHSGTVNHTGEVNLAPENMEKMARQVAFLLSAAVQKKPAAAAK